MTFYEWWDSENSDEVRITVSQEEALPVWIAAQKNMDSLKTSTNIASTQKLYCNGCKHRGAPAQYMCQDCIRRSVGRVDRFESEL